MKKDPRVIVDASGKHVMDFFVPCYMTDGNCRLKASAFMTQAQEMAMNSAEILGFGYDDLFPNYGMAWVLSRFHFKFLRPVMWREFVRIRTWHKGVRSVFYVRDFELLGEDGELSMIGTSSWVVLNLKERSLVRMNELPPVISPEPMLEEDAIEALAPKVMIPRKVQAEFVHNHIVSFSDIDLNKHTNNVRYIDWAIDCIDAEVTDNCPVKEVAINFNRETHLGETVSLYRHEEQAGEDHIFIIEGKVEDTQSFCARIVF